MTVDALADTAQAAAHITAALDSLRQASAILRPYQEDPDLYQARCLVPVSHANIALAYLHRWLNAHRNGDEGNEHTETGGAP